ncbi:MAG TPA: hypothetical protein VFB89_05845, partial [Gemmatimonadales bacterium]|nr:hypothetical protein [Gemmatimonadales bacterium]
MSRQIRGELVHVVGEIAPGARGTRHSRLPTELAFDTDLTGHVGNLIGEGGERLDHAVDRIGQSRDLALGFHAELALEIAVGDGGDDLGDAAHLTRQVARHRVHVVGEILPDAGDA